jgi:diguanylate cyclase (GGDEF)-like protein
MLGKSMDILYTTDDLKKARWIKHQTLLTGSFQEQIENISKSGKLIYTDVSASLLKDDDYKIIGITYYAQDITQKKEIEKRLLEQTERLNFQAHHDPLTRLPNRTLFSDRLHQSIGYAHRHHEKFAVFFIDLDNFKQINDTLGHHYGDEILKIVAQRLFECIREGDTLARLGGDEFTIIAQDLDSLESAANIAQKIIDAVAKKIVIDEHTLHVTVSIGISLYPKDSTHESNLLKYADSAMYQAKANGRNTYQFYSTEMTNLALEKAAMELELRQAIEEEQLLVYYQPQVDARSNKVVGVEALVRWEHPIKGMVMPNSFIGLAEETGLIKEVDNYVMHQAMLDMADWYRTGLNPGKLSLNLSLNQLMKKNFFSVLENTINETGFDVEWLSFEITESQMMLDPKKSIEKLNQLNRMGIEISIDDFGTGYSSLAYLKRLPVDRLKIDKSFIFDLPYNEEDCAITNAVIALAQSLNLDIVAEGVEHAEQVEYLLSKECHIIQGFHYSMAIPNKELIKYIKR